MWIWTWNSQPQWLTYLCVNWTDYGLAALNPLIEGWKSVPHPLDESRQGGHWAHGGRCSTQLYRHSVEIALNGLRMLPTARCTMMPAAGGDASCSSCPTGISLFWLQNGRAAENQRRAVMTISLVHNFVPHSLSVIYWAIIGSPAWHGWCRSLHTC